jgi:hypothetical protein
MNRMVFCAVAIPALLLGPASPRASAQDQPGEHHSGGIGFHDTDAPLGVRWWLSNQKLALDLGVGYRSEPSSLYSDEHLKGWAISAGVPIVLKSWPRFHALLRPGIIYDSQEVEAALPPAPFATDKNKTITVSGELEAEAFLVDNFSVSAATGIAWQRFDPAVGASENSFVTLGNNFTTVGFHAYLFK